MSFSFLSLVYFCRLFFLITHHREEKKKVQTDKAIYIKSLVRQRERESAHKSKRAKEKKSFSFSPFAPSLSLCLTPAGGSRQQEKEQ